MDLSRKRLAHRDRGDGSRVGLSVANASDSDDNDDDNDNDNNNDGDESEIQPRDSDDRALRPTNRNHRQERTDAKRKWIALETIRNIREGEEFVLLSRSESEIEEEDL